VANTNAHLCGALGRPGWVLLNENPEWRWSCSGENPLWYPSLSLFRCGRGEGWQPVLGTVMKVLATHAANSGMPDGTSPKEARS